MGDAVTARARELYRDALVWDTHSGFMPVPNADLRKLDIWRDAGVDYLSIDVGFDLFDWTHTMSTLAAFRHWILARPQEFVLAESAADVRRAKQEGRMAVTFDLEGMNALDGRVEMVEVYHRLGVRQMLVAYNRNNLAGGGCHDEDTGLTDFGRAVVREMNRVGMFVDVTHCGYRTCMDVMECSEQPVIFSHSNARAVRGHERNITDAQIKACARGGGVVGVVGLSLFLGAGASDAEKLADSVDYLLDVAGPDHVGIGLDFAFPVDAAHTQDVMQANARFWPRDRGYDGADIDFASPAELLPLTETLLRRGHEEGTVRQVLGGNFMRLAEQVWR
ncbi:MAG TPA: membrane dipeptidase [Steroidobacteraceae bacterium]|nr:membrane dipeptidase [Steroidobacteraceae bacterium]